MIKIEVSEGKIPWVVGIGTILLGILCIVLCVLYPGKSMMSGIPYYLLVCTVPVTIILAGVWLCLDARNRRLTVEDEALCYTNWSGRKAVFTLNDIAYCRTALENRGNRDYLKLYDAKDAVLCKLEYNMTGCTLFLQYLIDNQIKIECSEKSDYFLKSMLHAHMTSIFPEAIQDVVNAAYKEAKELVCKWTEDNGKLGVEWKMGLADYLEGEISEKKQLWEQKSCSVTMIYNHIQDEQENNPGAISEGLTANLSADMSESLMVNPSEDMSESLSVNPPEGYIIAIEGYLLKDGEFVIDKKDKAVCICAPIICVLQSLKIGEGLKISHYNDAVEELSMQLADLADALPRNRYHTETLSLNHELKDRL